MIPKLGEGSLRRITLSYQPEPRLQNHFLSMPPFPLPAYGLSVIPGSKRHSKRHARNGQRCFSSYAGPKQVMTSYASASKLHPSTKGGSANFNNKLTASLESKLKDQQNEVSTSLWRLKHQPVATARTLPLDKGKGKSKLSEGDLPILALPASGFKVWRQSKGPVDIATSSLSSLIKSLKPENLPPLPSSDTKHLFRQLPATASSDLVRHIAESLMERWRLYNALQGVCSILLDLAQEPGMPHGKEWHLAQVALLPQLQQCLGVDEKCCRDICQGLGILAGVIKQQPLSPNLLRVMIMEDTVLRIWFYHVKHSGTQFQEASPGGEFSPSIPSGKGQGEPKPATEALDGPENSASKSSNLPGISLEALRTCLTHFSSHMREVVIPNAPIYALSIIPEMARLTAACKSSCMDLDFVMVCRQICRDIQSGPFKSQSCEINIVYIQIIEALTSFEVMNMLQKTNALSENAFTCEKRILALWREMHSNCVRLWPERDLRRIFSAADKGGLAILAADIAKDFLEMHVRSVRRQSPDSASPVHQQQSVAPQARVIMDRAVYALIVAMRIDEAEELLNCIMAELPHAEMECVFWQRRLEILFARFRSGHCKIISPV